MSADEFADSSRWQPQIMDEDIHELLGWIDNLGAAMAPVHVAVVDQHRAVLKDHINKTRTPAEAFFCGVVTALQMTLLKWHNEEITDEEATFASLLLVSAKENMVADRLQGIRRRRR